MNQVVTVLDEKTLQERLRTRAPQMRDTLEAQIPRALRAQISPDDILQDVWMTAFRTYRSFRGERSDSLDRWLTSIVNRALIDKLKYVNRQKRKGDHHIMANADADASSIANLAAMVISPEKTPSRVAASSEAAHAINDALETLPESMREAIRLKYIEGFQRPDIARVMQKSESAVGSLIYHGLQRLRKKLGSSGDRFFSDVLP
ncbi:MAG TPA: RNA polymerase sigma factor [Phycisphaerae bacterium]|nr:RNA polymerase sigma factor [Phycisphaerae bacterium]